MKHTTHISSPTLSTLATTSVSRRRFVTGAASAGALIGLSGSPLSWGIEKAPTAVEQQTLSGKHFDLDIGYQPVNFTGKSRIATAVNGSVPGPILRWREGDDITLRVRNHLAHDSSIHWHGMILPAEMDGVPGMSFAGIKPGEYFDYAFNVQQSGTYWYHSHSGFQEQTGVYGAIVIEPKGPDPVAYDRDYVVQLSDWSDEAPEAIYAKLKKRGDYYNFNERTAGDLWRDIKEKGLSQTWSDRSMWNQMRMSERDIADVTAYTYTYLMNGATPDQGWTGLFKRGEKIRLRFINSAAMTIFDVRIPGLKMTVVAADGQNVEPFTIDEFRIGVAETYDVIVEPSDDSAYCVFAQSIDRSGFTRGTLSANPALSAAIPNMDPAPVLSHRDMGMAMAGMSHGDQNMGSMAGMDHSQHAMGSMKEMDHSGHDRSNMKGMDHSQHGMAAMSMAMPAPLGKAGFGSNNEITHVKTEFGPQVDARADSPQSGLDDPGIGLRNHQQLYGRKVLRYSQLRNLHPTEDRREPSREIQLHLTGNMHRYMWSVNGIPFADAEPLALSFGERVRITLVNDSMMTHPIHLHGVWSELETGDPEYIPRKHTIMVQPGSKISYLVTADAMGRWAYHCHLLYHMPGMMREVRISHDGGAA
ncbi:copper resistance system multicopper oxidase [Zhongshania aliphaticivorans]|uniref:Copper resistance protein CopA n=1 Tax=Zhongshania aliphaticivorans TaxID=1470434 RepID=A0A127M525_9GAMM|nr:copper resistance system multicopper oxidase [Zhongshania aliphaticivorans]AMO68332.1 copper resistance protein CopA [Zhongshania aliphaticivorans]